MFVAGILVLRNTSSAPKSVCVSSVLVGPRSWDLGRPAGVRGAAGWYEEFDSARQRSVDGGSCVVVAAARHIDCTFLGSVAERRARRRSRDGARIAMNACAEEELRPL